MEKEVSKIEKEKNVFFIGAHPDDVETGCGGTISKHLDMGDSVYVLIMTNGEKGKHPTKLKECIASLKILGVKKENIIFGNFPDGYLKDDQYVVNFIEKHLRKFNANRVYTHDPNDRHQDHRNCSNAVSSAARRGINDIFLFQGPSTRVPFEPHYFVEISEEQFNKKIKSIECYKSQIKKGILNLVSIKALAELYGSQHNVLYAEGFGINHVYKGENEI